MSPDACGVCGKVTTDEKTLYDYQDNPTEFVVTCCRIHNVKIVGSSDPKENLEPYVDDHGQPQLGFYLEIHELG